jgi:hypothetical protein
MRLRPFVYWKPQPVTLPISGPPLDLNRLLKVLTRNDVDFVVVGGSAAGFLGASRLTEDADCVVRRERANLERLASALRELHALKSNVGPDVTIYSNPLSARIYVSSHWSWRTLCASGGPHFTAKSDSQPLKLVHRRADQGASVGNS